MTGSVDQPIQNSVTESKYFVGVPYLAAIKHACVHNIGAHKSCFHSFDLLGQQSMGQRLVEAHCSKLTGTVILSKEKNKTYTVIKYSYRIIFNLSDLVSLLFFEFEFVTSFADSSKKTEKKTGTMKLSSLHGAVMRLPSWVTSTQAVLKRPRTLAMVTMCP